MATPTKYTYSIQADFPNHLVESTRLTLEVQASSIVTAIQHIDTGGDDCDIWFKDALVVGDKAVLDGLVAAHSGAPMPQPGFLPDGTPVMALHQRQADGVPTVAIAPTTGSEVVVASHNLCDKCSWFGDSARAVDETLSDHGDGLTWDSAHTHWIDMISGRCHNDDGWVAEQRVRNPGDPHGYQVVVKVSGVEQTMREPFETSGGDYEVIWETGQVVFFSAPASPPVASYSYATTSTFYLRPTSGKVLRVLKAEADIAMGAVMTDTVMYSIYALVDAVAPELVASNAVPSGTMVPIGEIVYKRMGQITAEAQGSYPSIEVLGASDTDLLLPLDEFRRKSRGTRSKVQALPFNYSTARDLQDAAKMEIRVHTKHDRPFDGDTVTITFYCMVQDQA
jgi:hypothetical protein